MQIKTSLVFIYNNGHFWNYFRRHLIKIYSKTHQIAPFFKKFSEELAPKHLCMHSMQCCDMHIYTSGKNYLHASVKSCNVCAFIAFWKKTTINKVFERSTSIYKNSHALVVPIVLQKHQFHGICEFSKIKTGNFTRSLKMSNFTRYKSPPKKSHAS